MKTNLLGSLLLIGLLAGGCLTPLNAKRPHDEAMERSRVEQRLKDIFDVAAKKDMARLDSYHLYGPDFTKFGGGETGRLDYASARQGEHEGLSAVNGLAMRAEDLKVDLFGNVAVTTFILDYSFENGPERVQKKDRSTIVLVKAQGEWKIVHEHFSPFKSPEK
ncbi:MAG TPA: nuclear transport factor 2 family protein [Candidatus Saccharimonadales bacterium]|nr:nuclear transport factor 2 family protein [Candidatus Saccharimonadales bacterium]